MELENLVVIPARLSSTRLPEKLLLCETGKPLIQHTYEAAQRSQRASSIVVAADDERMVGAVRGFGGQVHMTSTLHPSGTDRVAEIAESFPEVQIFVNVQGDEPDIHFADVDRLIELLQEQPGADMATLATPIRDLARLEDPACVKVVMDENRRALYFSRSPIPYPHAGADRILKTQSACFYQHVGLYAYRRQWLLEFAKLSRSTYEVAESLEQLRAVQHGKTILVEITDRSYRGIDTRDDYEAFVTRQRS